MSTFISPRLVQTAAALAVLTFVPLQRADASSPWHITGKISESCSCGVPCTCNFGESPSPHSFCWAVWSVDVAHGNYGDVDLSGLRLAGAQAEKGVAFYADDRATDYQMSALEAISREIWVKALKANGFTPKKYPDGFKFLGVKRANIEQTSGAKSNHVLIENRGRFDADYIIGIDGKTPLTVGNNWSINLTNNIKAKSHELRYHDEYGNKFDFHGTNSNQGDVDWSNETPMYFR